MEENKTEEKTWQEEICEQVESQIKIIKDQQVQQGNVDYLYKLVDIHKDLANEKYWKTKEEKIMYRESGNSYGGYGAYGGNYGTYGGGRRRDSRGRYMEGGNGSYGRSYRGEDAINEMAYQYGNYRASGNYGAKEDSAYKMAEAFKEFGFSIAEELEPQDKMMFKKAMQEIMQELER